MKFTTTIDRYIDKQMNAEEQHSFEQEMDQNSKLRFWVERYIQVNNYLNETHRRLRFDDSKLLNDDGLNFISAAEIEADVEKFIRKKSLPEQDDVKAFKETLYAVEQEVVNSDIQKPHVKQLRMWSLAAAVVLLLLVVGGVLFVVQHKREYSNEQLFAMYYEGPYNKNLKNRLLGDVGENNFSIALNSYEKAHYKEALEWFGQIPENDISYSASLFFSAMSHIELHEYTKAVDCLNKTQVDSVFSAYVDWYLSLCYLKLNDRVKAKECLQHIVAQKGYNFDQAEKLLQQL
jgi:hypothetical protein